ncbi:MAG: J domain-containing protein [Desulfobulbaceae bacterium]|nr:J domain-containing protein [Desulfobulbaceae bacterium]
MTTISKSIAAEKLVSAFVDIATTEDLILFVAGTDNMLGYCQELMEQYDRNKLALLTMEINSLCAAKGVLPGLLYSEIRKVLIALNRFHLAGHDHFAILGLPENATIEETKKAYRQLSRRYHPDAAGNDPAATQRFMEISGAYHAIMAARSDVQPPAGGKIWRKKSATPAGRHQRNRKRFFLTFIPLILALTAITFYVSEKYDEEALRRHVAASSTAGVLNSDIISGKVELETVGEENRHSTAAEETAARQILAGAPPPTERQPEKPADSVAEEEQPAPDAAPAIQAENPALAETKNPDPVIPVAAGEHAPAEPAPLAPVSLPEKEPAVHRTIPGDQGPASLNKPRKEPQLPLLPGKNSRQPAPEQKQRSDQETAIENILTQYADLYSAKEMNRFLALFCADATENGQPQAHLIDRYKSLFTHTEAIDLNLETIKWHRHQNGFEAESMFKAKYIYKDGHIKNHTGKITFFLTDEPDGLKIQSLDYVFIN